jgi:hypothetical protein
LLEKLMVAVRPEFRVEVLVVDPTDPVLGKRGCTVSGCDRSAREKGRCGGHSHRWRGRGRPDLAVFLADPGPPLAGRSQPGGCTVAGCHYGTGGRGLCMRHRDRWTRAGKPDPVPGRPLHPSLTRRRGGRWHTQPQNRDGDHADVGSGCAPPQPRRDRGRCLRTAVPE